MIKQFTTDEEKKYRIRWLISESNENEMEPVHITLSGKAVNLNNLNLPSLKHLYMY